MGADRHWRMGDTGRESFALPAMSEEQLKALLAKIKEDAGLQEKLKGAADLDAFLAIAKNWGFDVSKAEWLGQLKHTKQTLELSDRELESAVGGEYDYTDNCTGWQPSDTTDIWGCCENS